MIGLNVFHQLVGNPFCLFSVIELLDRKRESVVRAIVDAKDLESRAMLIGMGQNDCGHDLHYRRITGEVEFFILPSPRKATGLNDFPRAGAMEPISREIEGHFGIIRFAVAVTAVKWSSPSSSTTNRFFPKTNQFSSVQVSCGAKELRTG
ncbi:MAG: hypothetical protein ACLP9L_32910 [Thermoguttaceae bacterium]